MSLEYRSGNWSVIYRPTGRYGPRVRVPLPASIQDAPPARRWHDEFIAEWRAAQGQEELPRALTGLSVGTLWTEYMAWSELHHAKTTHRDIVNVGQWIRKYIGHFPAEEINIHHVQIYQRLRAAGAGRSIPRAINKECSYLGGMIKWAGRQGHITPRRLESDRLPYKRPLPAVLSVPEIEAIIGAAKPFYRAYFLCLFAMGLRTIEARRLKWNLIDWERQTVHMTQKGGTQKSLPMSPAVIGALRAIAPAQEIIDARRGDIYVFARPRGKRPEENNPVADIRKALRRACDRAKITKRVTPHMFRHSCATAMVDQGVNLRIIQQFLGHSTITATQIYTHVSMDNLRAAQASIGGDSAQVGHSKPPIPGDGTQSINTS